MKKIAILFSGNIGQFDYPYDTSGNTIKKNWNDIIKKYNIDVFAYTETNNFYYDGIQYFNDLETKIIVTNDDKERINTNTKFCDHNLACDIIEKNFLYFFGENLKKYKIEKYSIDYKAKHLKNNINQNIFLDYNSGRSEKNKYALISQFYKLYMCYNLLCDFEIENNFQYDIIIRCRFDVFIKGLLKNNINLFDLNDIIYTSYDSNSKHINDFWAIGNRKIMDNYCNYYINMSPNLINNELYFLLHKNGNILGIYNIKICETMYDISDSSEIGLQTIIKNFNYNLNIELAYDIFKSYNNNI